ncbi:MAG TPA: protein-glutamate O-methyltransferase CheR, partial [Kofleriaceae bacterium]
MLAVWTRAGARSALAYLGDLRDGRTPVDDLVNEIVVGETYFFRDAGQFELLRGEIVPDLRSRSPRGLAIWSAGCASGEEAYSLAIAASESEPDGSHDIVYASDVSTRALAAARAGVYGQWSMRGVPAHVIDRIAVQRDRSYVVRDRWRQRVEFAHGNLAAEALPAFPVIGMMDLVLCRNVLIYFDQAAVQRAAARLYSALRDGGYLLTSASDPPLWELAPFATMMTKAGVVYRRLDARRSETADRAAARAAEVLGASTRAPRPAIPHRDRAPRRLAHGSEGPTALQRAAAALATGAWHDAARLTAGMEDPETALIHVRATANACGTPDAEQACAAATTQFPTSAALHHVHALLLLELDRLDDAAIAERRVLFLDSTLAVGHLVMATIARRAGDLELARRSYRNARELL